MRLSKPTSKCVRWIIGGAFLGALLLPTSFVSSEDGYPADYKPSKPSEKGETNVINRVIAVATYMSDKLSAAGGKDSPMCYRNCITIPYNDILKCTEAKGSYAASESCEKEAAGKMATCDPKCK